MANLLFQPMIMYSFLTEQSIAESSPWTDKYHKEIYLCFSSYFVCSFERWSF